MTPKLTTRGAVTQTKIVHAATELVQEFGLAGLTMDEVCRRAGVSKSQLYHFFETREALIEAVATTTVDEVLGLQAGLFAELGTMDGIERWCAALVDLQIERGSEGGCPIGTLVGQTSSRHVATAAILGEGLTAWTEAIERGLAAMGDRGDFIEGFDPHREAGLFMVAVQGGLLLTDAHRDYQWLSLALNERCSLLREKLRVA